MAFVQPDLDIKWHGDGELSDDNSIVIGRKKVRLGFTPYMLFDRAQKDYFQNTKNLRFRKFETPEFETTEFETTDFFRWIPEDSDQVVFTETAITQLEEHGIKESKLKVDHIKECAKGTDWKFKDNELEVGRIKDTNDPLFKHSNGRALGLFYTGQSKLKKGRIIGTYTGLVMTDEQNRKLANSGRCEGCGFTGYEDAGRAGTFNLYVFDLPMTAELGADETSNGNPINHNLVVDGIIWRNETAFLNDYRSQPDGKNQDPNRRKNTAFLHVNVGEMALTLVVVVEDVAPMQELLVDYGDMYWPQAIAEHEIEMARENLKKKAEKERQRKKKAERLKKKHKKLKEETEKLQKQQQKQKQKYERARAEVEQLRREVESMKQDKERMEEYKRKNCEAKEAERRLEEAIIHTHTAKRQRTPMNAHQQKPAPASRQVIAHRES